MKEVNFEYYVVAIRNYDKLQLPIKSPTAVKNARDNFDEYRKEKRYVWCAFDVDSEQKKNHHDDHYFGAMSVRVFIQYKEQVRISYVELTRQFLPHSEDILWFVLTTLPKHLLSDGEKNLNLGQLVAV